MLMSVLFHPRICLLVFLVVCVLAGCVRGPVKPSDAESGKPPVSEPETEQVSEQSLHPPTDLTPRQLLEKTVAAYQSAFTYSDHGTVRIMAKMLDPEAEPEPWPCTVAFQRHGEKPAKLRLEIGDGKFVSDGDDCFAQIRLLPDQVLRFPAPEKWTLETLFQDVFLDQSMESGIPDTLLRFPPQLILLFANDPLKTLLPEGATAEFRVPQRIGELSCDLIHIASPQGSRLLWISRKNHALVRFDYFVEGAPVPEGIDSLRMVRLEMTDARFNWEIVSEAFQMQQPDDARQVSMFQPGEISLLGKTPENAKTVALKSLAEKSSTEEIRSSQVADWNGKTVVLCFWSAGGEASRGALAEMLKSRETFRVDERVLFLSVNLDGVASADAPDDEVLTLLQRDRQELNEWQIHLEPVLDVEGRLAKSLSIATLPSLVILGPKGTTEFYGQGVVAEPTLSETIRTILGGEKPSEKTLAMFDRQRQEHLASLKQMTETDFYALTPPPPMESRIIPKTVTRKEPDHFTLQRIWNQPLAGAGQVTLWDTVGDAGGEATAPETAEASRFRFLVPCEGNMLAFLNADGAPLKKEKPAGLLNDELLTLVRTGSETGGKRYIGVSSVSGRAVHVYDEQLKPVFSYFPDDVARTDARSSPKHLVADFRFVDVYGNGTLALVVGVLALDDTTGPGDFLCAVDLQGKEIWRDRSGVSPLQVDSRFIEGQRSILVLIGKDLRGSLASYDPLGKRLGEIPVGKGRQVLCFDVDDSKGDDRGDVCLISADRNRNDIRVETLDRTNQIRWSRPLPPGEYRSTEQIVTGDLLGDDAKEWLVLGPDGNVYVFDRDGTPLDSFSLGKQLSGLAVSRSGPRRLLLVSDVEGVTAWEIVLKNNLSKRAGDEGGTP